MPCCLVNNCLNRTGKKGQSPDIMLHKFPKDVARIKSWLQQTGQSFENIDALASNISEGQKKGRYFLCSTHFTRDCYLITPGGRVLRPDAVPSIFPMVVKGESIIHENLKKKSKRRRKCHLDDISVVVIGPQSSETSTEFALEEFKTEEIEETCDSRSCTIGTQTDFTISNSIILYATEVELQEDESLNSQALCQSESVPVVSTQIDQHKNNHRLILQDAVSSLTKCQAVRTLLLRDPETKIINPVGSLPPIKNESD